jgi:hypothetical protein
MDQIHIGKKSSGWQFCFQGLTGSPPIIKSWKEWQEELKRSKSDKPVIDEYGKRFSIKDFIKIVLLSKDEKYNHYDRCLKDYTDFDTKNNWKDEEGWSFISSDFS